MRLPRRLRTLLRCDHPAVARIPEPTRLRLALRPCIGLLEPRLVLNATAELNALGQLVITGGEANDTVQLEVNASDQLLLRDGNGNVIPIVGHPGIDTAPLAVSAITSNSLLVDLGGGDDVLHLQIPSSLNVIVMPGAGTDSTTLTFRSDLTSTATRTIDVASDNIRINAGSGSVDLRGIEARLAGHVHVGSANLATTFQLEDSSFVVDGRLTIEGDIHFVGSSSMINLADATLSATEVGNDLFISLGDSPRSEVILGTADDSAGEAVHHVVVDTAHRVSIHAPHFEITGRLAINQSSQMVGNESNIYADSISIKSDSILLHDVQARTFGGGISLSGSILVDGTLSLDSMTDQSAVEAERIVVSGSIDSLVPGEAILNFNTSETTQRGSITFIGAIGENARLHSATFRTGSLNIGEVNLEAGDLRIDALGTAASGSLSSLGGSIDIAGSLALRSESLNIDGKNITLRGVVIGQSDAQTLNLLATDSIFVGNAIIGFGNFDAVAGNTITLAGPVSLSGDLIAKGTRPTQVLSSSIQTLGSQQFNGGVSFLRSGSLFATEVSLGEVTNVAADIFFAIHSTVIGVDVRKIGDGTLIVERDSHLTGEISIEAGALRINGTTAADAGVIRIINGRLEGNGTIRGEVVTMGRSFIEPGPGIGALTIAELTLTSTATLSFQFTDTAGLPANDQIVVSGPAGAVNASLGSALLALEFDTAALPASEYILIRNDGSNFISGTFTAAFDSDGSLLSSPRTLTEGSLVLQDFGGSGRPAYLTYAGGDGNDVAIVTAGDLNIEAGNVTLVQREGSNLAIRIGSDLNSAQMATPVIRPIAAINEYLLRINGSPADQMLVVDLDNWIDMLPDAIQYTGEIFFIGGGPDDQDSIMLLDSNLASNDSPTSIRYSLDSPRSGVIEVTTHNDASQFKISFDQAESIAQALTVETVELQYSDFDEQIELSRDPQSPERTQVTSTSNGSSFHISFENPTQLLTVLGGGGDDAVVVHGFGAGTHGFAAALTLDGQSGDDSMTLLTDLTLGRGSVTGDLDISAESIVISGNIDTTGGQVDGQIQLTGGKSILISENVLIDSGVATIVADSAGGMFDSRDGSLVSRSSSEAIMILNASLMKLGNMDATTGVLKMDTKLPGDITQAIGTRILSERTVIVSAGSVDLSNVNNDFQQIQSIVAQGDITLTDSAGNLAIGIIDSRGNDVTLRSSGVIELSDGSIVADSATATLSAGVAILATGIPVDGQAANISAGTINLNSGAGGIGVEGVPIVIDASEALNANTSVFRGDIFLSSPNAVMPIGFIDAGSAKVWLHATSIQDATNDAVDDVVAGELQMISSLGIGSLRNLELRDLVSLSAMTNSGGIQLEHVSADPLTLTNLTSGSGRIEFRHSGSSWLSIERISSGDGNISITHQNGSISVVGSDAFTEAITAGMSSTISLVAMGEASDVTFHDAMGSLGGNITVTADRHIFLLRDGDLKTSRGNVFLTADARSGQFRGRIEMSDGATIDSSSGTVSLLADGDVILGGVSTQNGFDNAIFIESASGKVSDGGDIDIDLVANSGGVTIVAKEGIGPQNRLETMIDRLVANVADSGAIQIHETDGLELRSLFTVDGRISVEAGGTIIATEVVSINRNALDDHPAQGNQSRDIDLLATGTSSDILVGNITAMNGADVSLIAGDDVIDTNPGDEARIIADDLLIIALNGLNDTTTAIRLTTNVNDLVFSTGGTHPGDVFITEVDSINLASSDANDDSETLQTVNGSIVIVAGENIIVGDNNPSNDTDNLRDDVEIIARGERGRISLTAGKKIELGGATQLEASQSTQQSIFLTAPSIVLGSQIEMRTGNGIGIARWFSPRPMPGLTDTAFFDYTTVATNRLTQSGANDAFGELSLLIGRPGENGFTMNIDWGDSSDPNHRFQQIDNLPGNEVFVQRHIYLENDILNSTLNGRTSATAPLQVRFSVRHHESIVVNGDSVQQAASAEEFVEGRLLSSTDNPLTSPLLENGTATFTIPNLTIPVAFFPVRQIVPETVEPELFVRVEATQFFATSTLETKTTSASSTVSRDEYLQIRVLSLEPGGDDIAAPQRLPDDILSGDNLKKLFDELPDGRYEIQYVLGDGNERMLLRLDLRNHQPIVPGDELEGRQLKLKAIDPEFILRELQDQIIESQQLPEPLEASPASLDDAASFIDELDNSKDLTNSFFGNEAMAAASFVGAGFTSRRRWRRSRVADIPNPWSFAGRFVNRNSKPR